MAGRYFYAPVDSGYGDLGRSIGAGLQALGAGIAQRKDRKKADEDRARRIQQEDALFDLRLAEMGGGRGMAPAETFRVGEDEPRVVGMPEKHTGSLLERPQFFMDPNAATGDVGFRPSAAQFMDPDPTAGPGIGIGVEAGREGLGVERPRFRLPAMEVTTPDPRFRQLGSAENPFYIEDPEVRSQRIADAESARRRGDIQFEIDAKTEISDRQQAEQVEALTRSFMARNTGMTEDQARAQADLMVHGGARMGDIEPQESFRPEESGDSWVLFGDRGTVRETGVPAPTSPSSGRGVTATSMYTQRAGLARQGMAELNWLDRQRIEFGAGFPEDEYNEARQRIFERVGVQNEAELRAMILDGQEFGEAEAQEEAEFGAGGMEAPELQESPMPGAPARRGNVTLPDWMLGPRAAGGAAPGAGADMGDDDDGPLNDAEIIETAQRLQNIPERNRKKRLADAGYSDAQIKQIEQYLAGPTQGARRK